MPVSDDIAAKLNAGGDAGKAERGALKQGIPQDVLDKLNSGQGDRVVSPDIEAKLNYNPGSDPKRERQTIVGSFLDGKDDQSILGLKALDKSKPVEAQAYEQVEGVKRGFVANLKNPVDAFKEGGLASAVRYVTESPEKTLTKVKSQAFADKAQKRLNDIEAEIAKEKSTTSAGRIERVRNLQSEREQLQQRIRQQIASEVDPEVGSFLDAQNLNAIFDAVVDDPGRVAAELINGIVGDPELLLGGSFLSGFRTASGLAKTSKVAAAAATEGTINASIDVAQQLDRTGKVDPQQVKTQFIAGAVLSPILAGAGSALSRTPSAIVRSVSRKSGKTDIKVQKELETKINSGKRPAEAIDEVEDTVPVLTDLVDSPKTAEIRTKKAKDNDLSYEPEKTFGQADEGANPVDAMAEGNVSVLQPSSQKIHFNKFTETASDLLTPVSTVLGNISPKIKQTMNRLQLRVDLEDTRLRKRAVPFLENVKSLPKDVANDLDLKLKNGNFDEATSIIQAAAAKNPKKYGDLELQFNDVLDVFDELGTNLKIAGVDFNTRENFWPRMVKDVDGIKDRLGSDITSKYNKRLNEANAKKGTPLTKQEEAELMTDFLAEQRGRGGKPGFVKERKIDQLDAELNQFYDNSLSASLRYINRAVDSIETYRVFGHAMNNIDKVKEVAGRVQLEEGLGGQQARKLEEILTARFIDARKPVNETISTSKNLLYIATLGSVNSTLTQIGDLVFSMAKNGTFRTLVNAPKSALGKGLRREDIGLERIAQELESTAKSAAALDKVFKLSGFTAMDKFGKATFLNSAMSKAKSRLKNEKSTEKFRNETRLEFGDEVDDLIADLQSGNLSENVKLYLWNRLSEVQPISLMEMPLKYLQNPNGKLLYMLKTFTIKQLDFVRREYMRDIASGNPARVIKGTQGMIWYGMLFVSANTGVDVIKDALMGRDIELSDTAAANIWRAFGITEFAKDKAASGKVGQTLADQILPPVSVFDTTIAEDVKDLAEGNEFNFETLKLLPVVGKIFQERAFEQD